MVDSRDVEVTNFITSRTNSVVRHYKSIAHDLKNLIQIVSNNRHLLPLNQFDEISRRRINAVFSAVERMGSSLDALISYHKWDETESDVTNYTPVNLKDIVIKTCNFLRTIIQVNIKINHKIDIKLPRILGDATLLEQILLNIAFNAIDAMPDGGTIDFVLSKATQDDMDGYLAGYSNGINHILLKVKDTGKGIDNNNIDRVFDCFYSTKQEGSGLGLYIVHDLMKKHNGHIQVNSEIGMGTTVKLFFPIIETETMGDALAASGKPYKGINIFIIDDEANIRSTMKEILESHNHNVIALPSCEMALQLITQGHQLPELILLDIRMPGMDGITFFNSIRHLLASTKVVFTSGATAKMDDKILNSNNYIGLLRKPYKIDQVLEFIQVVANQRSSATCGGT